MNRLRTSGAGRWARPEAAACAAIFATALAAGIAAALMAGCQRASESPPESTPLATAPRAPAVELVVLVAGDEELAEGLKLLRGEWKARSGGSLQVQSIPLDELREAESTPADLIVFPSRWLGELTERGVLQPIRALVLEDRAWGLNDVYPALRNGEMKYGGQTMALPLGSPPLMAAYRAAPPSPTREKWPPGTWSEYRAGVQSSTGESEPAAIALDGHAAAFSLIARAVSYTEPRLRSEALFDPQDMAPRIAEPAFVKALAELVEEAAPRGDSPAMDFQGAMSSLRAGKAVAALGWPSRAGEGAVNSGDAVTVQIAELPAADSVYASSRGQWENQTVVASVTVLGVEGRLVGLCRATRNAVTALRLGQWLTSGDAAIQLSSRSNGTLWFRKSQESSQRRWLEGRASGGVRWEGLEAAAGALKTETPWMTPRIPGIDRYLAALADGVRPAVAGTSAPREALRAAAERWEAITDELGREQQAAAFRRHLGIEEYIIR